MTFEGTQTGTLDFKTPIPAFGKHVHITQVHESRIKDGKIVEAWMTQDRAELISQMTGPC